MTNPPATVQIQPVNTPEAAEQFLDVPNLVYANDPNWVPPLRSSVAKQFAPDNPFFQYGRLQRFIALDQKGRAVGRVAAIVNDRLIQKEQKAIGLFGYFECIDAADVAMALLEAACQWLREQGMVAVRGPIDLSTHNNCLFLVDGFDSPPYVMMPYNPPYYPQWVEQAGWQKAKDAYAYDFPGNRLASEYERAYQIAIKSGVNFRSIHLKGEGFQKDAMGLYDVFTKAFENNWSSTPRTQEEFMEEAKSLQSLVDPDVFWIAEVQGEMIGFFMALPDYNLALKHVNGKLNWFGILKFLWYRRSIDRVRVIAICVLPEYRRKMVAPALIYVGMKGGVTRKKPYTKAELSWVYEDNLPSRRIIEGVEAKIYKTYRMYEKPL
ncbi:GNAT family N-acetyltransferase [Egbenema bharatensis]|uniref:GNAT family N-acetyltransferase n=1 Tax=Egbenema bharatensis TaxID=3463334 RepID=UPI003A8A9CFD